MHNLLVSGTKDSCPRILNCDKESVLSVWCTMSDDIECDQFFYLLFILIILAIERFFPPLPPLRGKGFPDAVKETHMGSYLHPVINSCQV